MRVTAFFSLLSMLFYVFLPNTNHGCPIDKLDAFITGWNEWTADRHEEWASQENAFPDQFNDEYSRDLEPTKGALKDHYYYLLVNALRQYKGVNPIPTPSGAVTIDMSAGSAQWENVAPYYAAYTVVLEKFTGNGYESTKVADCAYKVDGRYMTVKIAKSDLSLTGHDYTINFSWTDNVHDEGDYTVFSGDIMDFYISGDVAPGARFKYSYISTADNAANTQTPDDTTQDTQSETSENVETDTDAEASANTTADSDTDTSAVTKGGCASVVSASLGLMLVAIMGTAVVVSKKKES